MGQAKVAITIDEQLISAVDDLVRRHVFPSRSRAIQVAVAEKLERMTKNRLARELGNLDPLSEKTLAEEGMHLEHETWPEY